MQSSMHKDYQCAEVSFSTGTAVDMVFVVYGFCMKPWFKIMRLSNFNALYQTLSIKRNHRRLKLSAGTPRQVIKRLSDG